MSNLAKCTAVACLLVASMVDASSKFYSLKQYKMNKDLKTFLGGNNTGTENPVIGIVSQTLEAEMKNDTRFKDYKTYIMKSYVTWVEALGARVIPLVNGEPESVTLDKLIKVNAVVFPGGDGDYLEYGRLIFNKVKEINDNGTYLPLWGTCMGYENMVSYVADEGWNVLGIFDLDSASLTLDFAMDPQSTKLYQWLGNEAYLFNDHNVTYNSHHWSMDPNKFNTDKGLASMFYLTAISHMPDGRPIVASIESEKYPFFGTQFHPEKPIAIFKED